MMFLDCFKFFLIVSEFLNTMQRSIVIELARFTNVVIICCCTSIKKHNK